MNEHGTAHLIVASPQTGLPVGIVSTLDIARVVSKSPHRPTARTHLGTREPERPPPRLPQAIAEARRALAADAKREK